MRGRGEPSLIAALHLGLAFEIVLDDGLELIPAALVRVIDHAGIRAEGLRFSRSASRLFASSVVVRALAIERAELVVDAATKHELLAADGGEVVVLGCGLGLRARLDLGRRGGRGRDLRFVACCTQWCKRAANASARIEVFVMAEASATR